MTNNVLYWGVPLLLILCIVLGCEYKKGEKVVSGLPGDTMQYLIVSKGQGEKIMAKARKLKKKSEIKGDLCTIKLITDSVSLKNTRAILLFRSVLPNIKDDMLTKGFFGTFTSKQEITYVLVSYEDFKKAFRPGE
jgi:hypothetical protein